MMSCINVAVFVLISQLEKDHSMIETRSLKNVVIFVQTILSFVLSRKNNNELFLSICASFLFLCNSFLINKD